MLANRLKNSRLFKRRSFRVVLAIALVVLLGVGTWLITDGSDAKKDVTPTSDPGDYINLEPPTEQDIKDAESHKKDLSDQQSQPQSSTQSGKRQVTPVVTNVQANEVNAYISGVFEDGGTCGLTATKGSQTVTKTSKGFKNVSYTSCEPLSLSPALSNGIWKVVVSYSSSSSEGQSQPRDYTVN